MKYVSGKANSISKIFQLQLKNECKMLILVHEDLHELALPNFPDSHRLPLAHSAAANAFCFNPLGCFMGCFFSARKFLILLPRIFVFSYLLLFMLQISAQNLIGVYDLGSEKIIRDYVYLEIQKEIGESIMKG